MHCILSPKNFLNKPCKMEEQVHIIRENAKNNTNGPFMVLL
jgi:hypothetical protein